MLVDGAHVLLEQLGHRLLGKPNRLVEDADFHARPAVLGLVEDELAGIVGQGWEVRRFAYCIVAHNFFSILIAIHSLKATKSIVGASRRKCKWET
jgi:hypothetical protein